LKHHENSVAFELTALDYAGPEKHNTHINRKPSMVVGIILMHQAM